LLCLLAIYCVIPKDVGHLFFVSSDKAYNAYIQRNFPTLGFVLTYSMNIEHHTLPVLALLLFIGLFGLNIFSSDTTENRLEERTLSFRTYPFSGQVALSQVALGVSQTGLVSYWSFNEDGGVTLIDGSGNANVGITQGTPYRVHGKEGGAFYFDGVEDYVAIDSSSLFDVAQTFTLSAWIKLSEPNAGVILSKNGLNDETIGGYELAVWGGGLSYGIKGRASVMVRDDALLSDEWVYVAVVYDAVRFEGVRMYVNGRHALSGIIAPPSLNTEDELLIGRSNTGDFFKGSIDEVKIYNTALSGKDILDLYNSLKKESLVQSSDSKSLQANAFSSLFLNFTAGF